MVVGGGDAPDITSGREPRTPTPFKTWFEPLSRLNLDINMPRYRQKKKKKKIKKKKKKKEF